MLVAGKKKPSRGVFKSPWISVLPCSREHVNRDHIAYEADENFITISVCPSRVLAS